MSADGQDLNPRGRVPRSIKAALRRRGLLPPVWYVGPLEQRTEENVLNEPGDAARARAREPRS